MKSKCGIYAEEAEGDENGKLRLRAECGGQAKELGQIWQVMREPQNEG